MKKFLSLVALSVVLLLPLSAKAVEIDPNNACEKSCPTENGRCTQTCQIKVKDYNVSTDGMLNFKLTYGTGVTLKEVNPSSGWTKMSNDDAYNLSFIGTSNESAATVATIVFDVTDASTDCAINLGFGEKEVVIKSEATTTVKTGATLPIVILGSGIAAAFVIYMATKKTKMYKI